ncbi:hypothetical protein BGX26_006085 [Mortierella sp. AD094]|nr:hypothetical protein BGX26_006085 [Mortierella sp. AD094]
MGINGYNTNTDADIRSLDRKVTERKQAHTKQQIEYQKKKITKEQRVGAIASIKGQLDTALARMEAEAQRSVSRATSKRDTLLREIEVYREQQTRLIRSDFDARMRLYIQQEQERRGAPEARERLHKKQAQEIRDAHEISALSENKYTRLHWRLKRDFAISKRVLLSLSPL